MRSTLMGMIRLSLLILGLLIGVYWCAGPIHAYAATTAVTGADVKTVQVSSGHITDTTSTSYLLPSGTKTIRGRITGTGAIAQVLTIKGTFASTAIEGSTVCTLTLSASTTAYDDCPPFTAAYPRYFTVTTGSSGTIATSTVTVGVGE